jgi:hypothetical protein
MHCIYYAFWVKTFEETTITSCWHFPTSSQYVQNISRKLPSNGTSFPPAETMNSYAYRRESVSMNQPETVSREMHCGQYIIQSVSL